MQEQKIKELEKLREKNTVGFLKRYFFLVSSFSVFAVFFVSLF